MFNTVQKIARRVKLQDVLVVGTAIGAVAIAASMASAGTDATFSPTTTILTNWSTGSLGKMAGVACVGVAVVSAIIKFDWKFFGSALGVGLAASQGPGIVAGLMSATF